MASNPSKGFPLCTTRAKPIRQTTDRPSVKRAPKTTPSSGAEARKPDEFRHSFLVGKHVSIPGIGRGLVVGIGRDQSLKVRITQYHARRLNAATQSLRDLLETKLARVDRELNAIYRLPYNQLYFDELTFNRRISLHEEWRAIHSELSSIRTPKPWRRRRLLSIPSALVVPPRLPQKPVWQNVPEAVRDKMRQVHFIRRALAASQRPEVILQAERERILAHLKEQGFHVEISPEAAHALFEGEPSKKSPKRVIKELQRRGIRVDSLEEAKQRMLKLEGELRGSRKPRA